jgi:hypothetical protein
MMQHSAGELGRIGARVQMLLDELDPEKAARLDL